MVTFVHRNIINTLPMKALLPPYCRALGYLTLLLSIFTPFILLMYGVITDQNLLLVKEVVKLSMIVGLLLILLAHTKNENTETEQIRIKAMRTAFFLTILYIFGIMLYRLYKGDIEMVDTSSFVIFMAMNVICQEYGIKKSAVSKLFKN